MSTGISLAAALPELVPVRLSETSEDETGTELPEQPLPGR